MASPLVINPSKDGRVIRVNTSHTNSFSDFVLGDGTEAQTGLEAGSVLFTSDTTENMWNTFHRLVFIFDTSDLPNDCTIDSATLVIKCTAKSDALSFTPDVAVYGATTLSDTNVVAADYQTVASTVFSNVIAYGDITAGQNQTFTLNAAGLAAISKTGKTKFCLRNANCDVANSAPSWASSVSSAISFSQSGSITKPVLTVNYTEAPPVVEINGIGALKAGRAFQRM